MENAKTVVWSEEMGNMHWEQANLKCASIGMRLPKIGELESAHKAGILQTWKNENDYWSSTPAGSNKYYGFNPYSGKYAYTTGYFVAVRCRI